MAATRSNPTGSTPIVFPKVRKTPIKRKPSPRKKSAPKSKVKPKSTPSSPRPSPRPKLTREPSTPGEPHLLNLPAELLLSIIDQTRNIHDILALRLVCRTFHSALHKSNDTFWLSRLPPVIRSSALTPANPEFYSWPAEKLTSMTPWQRTGHIIKMRGHRYCNLCLELRGNVENDSPFRRFSTYHINAWLSAKKTRRYETVCDACFEDNFLGDEHIQHILPLFDRYDLMPLGSMYKKWCISTNFYHRYDIEAIHAKMFKGKLLIESLNEVEEMRKLSRKKGGTFGVCEGCKQKDCQGMKFRPWYSSLLGDHYEDVIVVAPSSS